MSRILVRNFLVPADAIDGMGHVNNLEYVRWMQDAAIEHSAARGWPMERYLRTKTAWVVRKHTIEYVRPAFAGDSISLFTWVAGYRQTSSQRRYLFWRASDQQALVRAETLWVFVDAESGRARPIPAELAADVETAADDEVLELARAGGPGLMGPPPRTR
jgi:acyl-CoA thioester hydrolase